MSSETGSRVCVCVCVCMCVCPDLTCTIIQLDAALLHVDMFTRCYCVIFHLSPEGEQMRDETVGIWV